MFLYRRSSHNEEEKMQRPRAAMIAIGLLMFAAPQMADADPFSDLATIVTSNYPLKNKVATGGPNWCFQVQAGNEFNPWSAAMKNPETKQLEWAPFDGYQSKKIMLVGTIPGSTKMGTFDDYHALLFGIDFLDNTPYSFQNIMVSLSTKAETGGESRVKSPPNVLLPEDN
jgi:hypothetical protein